MFYSLLRERPERWNLALYGTQAFVFNANKVKKNFLLAYKHIEQKMPWNFEKTPTRFIVVLSCCLWLLQNHVKIYINQVVNIVEVVVLFADGLLSELKFQIQ